MIEDLIMKDDIRLIIELIEDNGHYLDEETISSLTSYVERNLSSLNKICDISVSYTHLTLPTKA